MMQEFLIEPLEATVSPDSLERLRVLHLIGQLSRGGCELQLASMIGHLDSRRIQSVVGSFWSEADQEILERLRQTSCPVFRLGKRKHVDIVFVVRLARLIRMTRPDLIHAWLMSAGLWGRLASLLVDGPPTVVSYRSEGVHNWLCGAALDRRLSCGNPLAIVNSTRVRDTWARRLGWDPSRLWVIPNGVDCDRFAPGIPDAGSRARLKLPLAKFIVCMIGTLKPEKNWPLFIDVAKAVTSIQPDVAFAAVGGGPLLDEMIERATTIGLSADRLRFLGNRTDVAEILTASDVVISTSAIEGMSNAILEAMACGLPVVATRVSGSTELVREGETGFLVDHGDVHRFAERIQVLLQQPHLAHRFGSAARQVVLREYSLRNMAGAHERAYFQAVAFDRSHVGRE